MAEIVEGIKVTGDTTEAQRAYDKMRAKSEEAFRGASAAAQNSSVTIDKTMGQTLKRLPEQLQKSAVALLLVQNAASQMGGEFAAAAGKISGVVGMMATGGTVGVVLGAATAGFMGLSEAVRAFGLEAELAEDEARQFAAAIDRMSETANKAAAESMEQAAKALAQFGKSSRELQVDELQSKIRGLTNQIKELSTVVWSEEEDQQDIAKFEELKARLKMYESALRDVQKLGELETAARAKSSRAVGARKSSVVDTSGALLDEIAGFQPDGILRKNEEIRARVILDMDQRIADARRGINLQRIEWEAEDNQRAFEEEQARESERQAQAIAFAEQATQRLVGLTISSIEQRLEENRRFEFEISEARKRGDAEEVARLQAQKAALAPVLNLIVKQFLRSTGEQLIATGIAAVFRGLAESSFGLAAIPTGLAAIATGTTMVAGSLAIPGGGFVATGAGSVGGGVGGGVGGAGGSSFNTQGPMQQGQGGGIVINVYGAMTDEERAMLINQGLNKAKRKGLVLA